MRYLITTEGLSCGHCEAAVEASLLRVPGVTEADADHASNTVEVTALDGVAPESLEAAVAAAGDGYRARSITTGRRS